MLRTVREVSPGFEAVEYRDHQRSKSASGKKATAKEIVSSWAPTREQAKAKFPLGE